MNFHTLPLQISLADQATFRNQVRAKFTAADFLYREVAQRLLARLQLMKHQSDSVYEIDQRYQQLQRDFLASSSQSKWTSLSIADCLSSPPSIQADLILSNLSLSIVSDWQAFLPSVLSLLKSQGLFLFCVLGPDSLLELREAFSDQTPHVLNFIDMHHIGDALLQVGFDAPVMETQRLTLQYGSLESLIRDSRCLGAQNALVNRSRGCMPKAHWQTFEANFSALKVNDHYPVTIELIFGHAWKSNNKPQPSSKEQSVAIEDIIRKQS